MIWIVTGIFLWLVWFSFRYAWWRSSICYHYPRILMYHMITDPVAGASFNGLRVSPTMFKRQLCWFKDNGWTSFTISELVENHEKLPEKSVVITFDDGYEDNYTNAYPLLKKYNFKATLFLVADRHNRDWSVQKKQHHDSGELGLEPKLNDAQVAEMLASGLVELGGHTQTHANFATISEDEKRAEIFQSKKDFEKRYAVQVNSFAYPFGIYLDSDAQLVEEAGYTSAVTTKSGIESFKKAKRFQLRRIKISGKDNFLAFVLRIKGGKRGWLK